MKSTMLEEKEVNANKYHVELLQSSYLWMASGA